MPINCRIILTLLFCIGLILCNTALGNSVRISTQDVSLSDKYAYRVLTRQLASHPTQTFSDNIKPISFREIHLLQKLNSSYTRQLNKMAASGVFRHEQKSVMSNRRFLFRPITEVRFFNINSSRNNPDVTANAGESVGGHNTNVFSSIGNIYFKDYFAVSHETRIKYDQAENHASLYKFQIKKAFSHLSLSYAKENLVLGPGYFGNIMLSDNVEPENIALLKTELPYQIPYLGSFRGYLWHIWYQDEQRENQNPKLLGLHLSLKPNKHLELGISRTSYYGGNSNNAISGARDLWKLTTAEDENIPSSINTDQLAGVDASLYLPQIHKYTPFKGLKLYTERVWNDIKAFWQKEDRKDGTLVQMLGTSFLYGAFLTTGKLDIHFEFVKTTELIYAHHDFGRYGASVNGYVIGHHIGRDSHAYLSSVYYEWRPKIHLTAGYAWIERGLNLNKQQMVNEVSAGVHLFSQRNLQLAFNTAYIKRDRTDIDNSPVFYRFIDQNDDEVRVTFNVAYQLY